MQRIIGRQYGFQCERTSRKQGPPRNSRRDNGSTPGRNRTCNLRIRSQTASFHKGLSSQELQSDAADDGATEEQTGVALSHFEALILLTPLWRTAIRYRRQSPFSRKRGQASPRMSAKLLLRSQRCVCHEATAESLTTSEIGNGTWQEDNGRKMPDSISTSQ